MLGFADVPKAQHKATASPALSKTEASPAPTRKITLILLFLITVTAAIVFHTSSYRASNLDTFPDSLEYGIGASHLVTDGNYYIQINGERLPPRYPPWFSLFILAPSCLIFGSDPGNGIYPITLFAVLGAVFAFLAGRKISGNWGGLLAAVTVIALPVYRGHARQIMTDVPCSVLFLAAFLLYRQIKNSEPTSWRKWLASGCVAALIIALRPAAGFVVIPFLWLWMTRKEGRLRTGPALLFPVIAIIIAGLIYNLRTWGTLFRNGYNFWSPVPYDYFSLTFAARYLTENLKTLFEPASFALIVATAVLLLVHWILSRKKTLSVGFDEARSLGTFVLLAAGPLTLLHLFYFSQEERFFLPLTVLLAPLAGGLAGKWLNRWDGQPILVVAVPVMLLVVFLFRFPDGFPLMRIAEDEIASSTPDNAIILSDIDPVHLEFFAVKKSHRRIIPLSRKVEYACKAVAKSKIENPDPAPQAWWDHRCNGLLKAGARDVVPFTADERTDQIIDEVKKGTPVFLDISQVMDWDQPLLERLKNDCELAEHGNALMIVKPK